VDNPYPEESAPRGWLAASGLAIVETLPIAGPMLAAFGTEAVRQAQTRRIEEWAAMTGARLDAVERAVGKVDVEDPEFLASLARLQRAADETADVEKRVLLADVASRSGSWSEIPYSRRAEFVGLVAELTPAQIAVIAYCDDVAVPEGIRAMVTDGRGVTQDRIHLINDDGPIDLPLWIEMVTRIPRYDAWRVYRAMSARGVLKSVEADTFSGGMPRRFTTSFGRDFVRFLRAGKAQ
jgi:hypothetical protein